MSDFETAGKLNGPGAGGVESFSFVQNAEKRKKNL
jgi:hypothetical protein